MSWLWDQSAGELRRDGVLVSRGYSGKERGKNNPKLQGVSFNGLAYANFYTAWFSE